MIDEGARLVRTDRGTSTTLKDRDGYDDGDGSGSGGGRGAGGGSGNGGVGGNQ